MRKVLIIIAILTLTGCAEKSRFDCPYGDSPSCASMGSIDKMIKSDNALKKDSATCTKSNCAAKDIKATPVTFPIQTEPNSALRVPEEVMQLWIAPYEASSGIYYQQAYVNIIVKDASWQAPGLDDASKREDYHG